MIEARWTVLEDSNTDDLMLARFGLLISRAANRS